MKLRKEQYYGKAGLTVPQPSTPEDGRRTQSAEEMALGAVEPIDPHENARVLQQILMHLDCDEVGMLDLHELRLLLHNDPVSNGHRYTAVLNHCFSAMRLNFSERPTHDAQWRYCKDAVLMLSSLQVSASDRKLRLFAVACCRRLPDAIADPRCQHAVDLAEQFADGRAGVTELRFAEEALADVANRKGAHVQAAYAVEAKAADAAGGAALMATVDSDLGREDEGAAQADLLRCVLGSPFRAFIFLSEWRSDTAVALAAQMYESRDFSAMPILADALQDVGCDSADVLDHCRSLGPHVRGCWVVDLVLGKA